MRLPKITLSIAALAAANLVPLAGVLLLDWNAEVIVLLYWTENVVVGFYNVLRMGVLRVEKPVLHLEKLLAIPFFCLHFGGFCAVHGVFLLAFFKVGGGLGHGFPDLDWPGHLVFLQMLVAVIVRLWRSHPPGMQWPVLCLFVSHGVSFVQNYLLGKEYASATMQGLMARPYTRIVLLHFAIIAGGLPVMVLGSPVPLLFVLVGLKIGLDVWLHVRSHRAAPAAADRRRGRRQVEPASAADG